MLARFKIIDETAYILKSKANADRLLKSIADYENSFPNKTS
jgi:PHD/YefM family antitoxin component YafN of YafNO toxin-antitoxin module